MSFLFLVIKKKNDSKLDEIVQGIPQDKEKQQ